MPLHDSVNLFGGFAPFPNTVMIPTMGLQSDVIGFRFGFGYEKGKRTLRAMSNEQFNTLNEEAEQAIYKEHDTTAINFFKQELQTWTALQHSIIEKTVIIEQMKASRTPSAMAEVIQALNTAITAQGGTVTWENLADTWNKFFGGGQIGTSVPDSPTPIPPTEIGATAPGDTSPHIEPTPTATPTATKTYSVSVPTRFATNPFRVTATMTMHKTVSQWKDFLAYYRNQLTKVSSGVQRQFLTIITKISNTLHEKTGKWY